MEHPSVTEELEELDPLLKRAFGPLKKRALGLAIGIVSGGLLFAITAYHLVFQPSVPAHLEHRPFGDDAVGHLRLLGQYFAGYEPDTWYGAFLGFCWAAGLGFVLGVAIAALRNTVVRVSLFTVRAKGNLDANKGFLDQI